MPALNSLRALLPEAAAVRRHLPGALGGAAVGGVTGATVPDAEDGGEQARNALIGALVGGAGGAGVSRLMKGPAIAPAPPGTPQLEALTTSRSTQGARKARQLRKFQDTRYNAELQRGQGAGSRRRDWAERHGPSGEPVPLGGAVGQKQKLLPEYTATSDATRKRRNRESAAFRANQDRRILKRRDQIDAEQAQRGNPYFQVDSTGPVVPLGPSKQGSFQKRAFVQGIQAACTQYGVTLGR